MAEASRLHQLIRDPKIREALERIVAKEEEIVEKRRTDPIFKGLENAPPYWDLGEVGLDWHIVRRLVYEGLLEAVGGRRKLYLLKDREVVKRALQEVRLVEAVERAEAVPVCRVEEVPEDLFSTIVGYDDVKRLFLMSLRSERPTHILMVGPPASAKTVFLLEIARLKNAFYLLGGSATKVGLIDQLFMLKPSYVLLDEIDKMGREDLVALLSLMETGIVKEVKHDRTREMVLPAKVYAACNVESFLPPELLSRFQFKLHFRPYTRDEFLEVSRKVLVMREGIPEDLANYIAEQVARLGALDVRECIGIARLAKTREDVDFLIEVKRRYGRVV
jgi:Holliday junction DNA helicase RuvB